MPEQEKATAQQTPETKEATAQRTPEVNARKERLLNDSQFVHYMLASERMSVADVLNVEKRKKAIQDLSDDDLYWDLEYSDIGKRSNISHAAARKLVDYFEKYCSSLKQENRGAVTAKLFSTSEFKELCRFMPTLGSQGVQELFGKTYTESNTWLWKEYQNTKDSDKAHKNAMRLAKRCEKIHDFLEMCQIIYPEPDQLKGTDRHPLYKVQALFGEIAYASIWMYQFLTSKESQYSDRMPSQADMGDTKWGFWVQFLVEAPRKPYSWSVLNNMSQSESKLIRWPSELAIDSGCYDLQNLTNERRDETYKKGVLKNVDFKEFKELTKKLVEACIQDRNEEQKAYTVDSTKAEKLKRYMADGTLFRSIRFESEGERLRMTVANSLYEDFGLTPPLRTAQQKAEPQNPPPQRIKPKPMGMGGMY